MDAAWESSSRWRLGCEILREGRYLVSPCSGLATSFLPGSTSGLDTRVAKTATMLLPSLTSAVILAGLSVAQTPPGHKPEVTARLDLIVGSKVLAVPGTALTKAGG